MRIAVRENRRVPDATYSQRDNWEEVSKQIGEDNMWKINRAFLDQQVDRVDSIILTDNPFNPTGRSFAEEVIYLDEAGFGFVKDGFFWRAVK